MTAVPLFAMTAQETEIENATARVVQAHVGFLADDLLEGRGTGTRGHEIAMSYVAAQFTRLGLEPAGGQSFLQPLTLRETRIDIDAGRLAIRLPGEDEVALAPLAEMLTRPAAGSTGSEIAAPAVFVGFGVCAPEFGYDDFAGGIDVRGKIAVVLAGSPRALPSTARAHYSREKTAELVQRGAVGIVTLETPAEERRAPWALTVHRARFPAMRLVNADGSLHEAYPELRATASVSRAAAGVFFQQGPRSVEEVWAAAERSEPQAFPLPIELALSGRAEVGEIRSANVLGWLPGTDAALEGEPLVLTAHLDHLGIGPVVDGDGIYNGAIDNALGVGLLLAVAEQLAASARPRRPVLFAALTAEEKGLLGATHLARHPPSRVRHYAANINLDMPVLQAPTRDVVGIGAEHTTLGASLAAVAVLTGFTVSPDPAPDEVVFVRSDQYPFIRAGVPALFLKLGHKGLDPAFDLAALEREFRLKHYHKPSDDLSRPLDWPTAGAVARLAAELVRTVANDDAPPAWLPEDFFGTRFGRATKAPVPSGP